jgi:RNA polymerase sigma-70 factor (ECF subfamily)
MVETPPLPETNSPGDDRALVEDARKGDRNAFMELVNRYESRVAATVIGMLGPGPEAEDIGQDVFVRFFQALNGFRGESSVGTYLVRIAINLCFDEIRRRKRQRALFAPAGEDRLEALTKDAGAEARIEVVRLVRQGLGRLEPKFRAVIVLRLVDGFSSRETAAILGLPLGTVCSRLARGQKMLKKVLMPLYHTYPQVLGEGDD